MTVHFLQFDLNNALVALRLLAPRSSLLTIATLPAKYFNVHAPVLSMRDKKNLQPEACARNMKWLKKSSAGRVLVSVMSVRLRAYGQRLVSDSVVMLCQLCRHIVLL